MYGNRLTNVKTAASLTKAVLSDANSTKHGSNCVLTIPIPIPVRVTFTVIQHSQYMHHLVIDNYIITHNYIMV